MSHRTILTKDGFVRHRWNDELRSTHQFRKVSDGIIVVQEDTNKEIARYDTREAAEQGYWELVDGDDWLLHLRDTPEIESDVTIGDLIAAIQQHEALADIVSIMFGDDWASARRDSIDAPIRINHNYHFDGENLFDTYTLSHDNKSVMTSRFIGVDVPEFSCECDLSLLEIFQALFGGVHQSNHFTCENDVLSLRSVLGETVDSPIEHLFDFVEINSEITLNHLFRWVRQNEMLMHFISGYSWCEQIEQFHREAELPKEAADLDDSKLHRAVVCRHFSVDKYRRSDPLHVISHFDFRCYGEVTEDRKKWCQPRYAVHYDTTHSKKNVRVFSSDDGATSKDAAESLFHEFCQRVGIENYVINDIVFEEGTPCPEEEAYGIGFSPAYHYSHLPFTLDHDVQVIKSQVYSRKGRVTEDREVWWTGRTHVTLLDLLDAIYWEISFYGGPENRDDQLFDLQERVAEVKDFPENPDERRTKFFASFDEMLRYDASSDPDGPYDFYSVDQDLDTEPDSD